MWRRTYKNNSVVSTNFSKSDMEKWKDKDIVSEIQLTVKGSNLFQHQIALLDILQEIEQQHNRKRIKRWGPRTLDLDIIIFNELEINEDRLTIPHPEMIKRDFVLIPLLEITNYDFLIPKYGKIKKFI